MPSVHLVYGFCEGQWHGKKFRQELQRRGFSTVKSLQQADYVIGHSAGCFNIPLLRDNQVLILINPPYWPERTLAERAWNEIKQLASAIRPANNFWYHLYKTFRNIANVIRHPVRNWSFSQHAKTFNLETEVKHYQTILVRNDGDPWLTSDLDKLQNLNPHLVIKRLPGEHDECWLHPAPYIDFLENYPKAHV